MCVRCRGSHAEKRTARTVPAGKRTAGDGRVLGASGTAGAEVLQHSRCGPTVPERSDEFRTIQSTEDMALRTPGNGKETFRNACFHRRHRLDVWFPLLTQGRENSSRQKRHFRRGGSEPMRLRCAGVKLHDAELLAPLHTQSIAERRNRECEREGNDGGAQPHHCTAVRPCFLFLFLCPGYPA